MKPSFWLEIKKQTKIIIDRLKKQSLEQNRTILDEIQKTGRYI
jgi:hypothetical protein